MVVVVSVAVSLGLVEEAIMVRVMVAVVAVFARWACWFTQANASTGWKWGPSDSTSAI